MQRVLNWMFGAVNLLLFLMVLLAPSPWRWMALGLIVAHGTFKGIRLGIRIARQNGLLDQKKPRQGP